jgi:hypothetical protein
MPKFWSRLSLVPLTMIGVALEGLCIIPSNPEIHNSLNEEILKISKSIYLLISKDSIVTKLTTISLLLPV